MVVLRSATKASSQTNSQFHVPPEAPQHSGFSAPPTPVKLREPCPSQPSDTLSPPLELSLNIHASTIVSPPQESESHFSTRDGKRKRGQHEDQDLTSTEVGESSSIAAENAIRILKDKGKGKWVESSIVPIGSTSSSAEAMNQIFPEPNVEDRSSLEPRVLLTREEREEARNQRMEHFREIAKMNASRFARFECDLNKPAQEEKRENDWPGPFSSAMKIIRDRANKAHTQKQFESLGSKEALWTPKNNSSGIDRKINVPSLEALCMKILASNADAIVSLEGVPDQMRTKLSNLLCKSRKMNGHFLGLLLEGSPTEIRLKDCSWLDEEVFLQHFKEFDSTSLKILQLDQCGRSIAHYTLLPILSHSPCRFPELITLSITGACRLTDSALEYLISSTPNLKSLNISRCSLLTSDSIAIISSALGKFLQELYIDECEALNAFSILPALKTMTQLHVLSLSGISSVNDAFIQDLVLTQGHTFKELVLSNCPEITDASVEAIANWCPGLCSLDVCNSTKLTDNALGHLANGCRVLEKLKFCRNEFSDEAVAAFLEISGMLLKHLSLNSVRKVEKNTALALAKCGKSLLYLDVSWCRRLSDDLVGLVVDTCHSLKEMKMFGCSQITDTFFNGRSNQQVRVVGAPMSPVMFCDEEMF